MTKEAFDSVESMISKECRRYSLFELCENWGVSTDDFDEFMALAHRGFEAETQNAAGAAGK